MHEHDIANRDLKPDAFMFDEHFEIKMVDWTYSSFGHRSAPLTPALWHSPVLSGTRPYSPVPARPLRYPGSSALSIPVTRAHLPFVRAAAAAPARPCVLCLKAHTVAYCCPMQRLLSRLRSARVLARAGLACQGRALHCVGTDGAAGCAWR